MEQAEIDSGDQNWKGLMSAMASAAPLSILESVGQVANWLAAAQQAGKPDSGRWQAGRQPVAGRLEHVGLRTAGSRETGEPGRRWTGGRAKAKSDYAWFGLARSWPGTRQLLAILSSTPLNRLRKHKMSCQFPLIFPRSKPSTARCLGGNICNKLQHCKSMQNNKLPKTSSNPT